jgi:hypothetical protein
VYCIPGYETTYFGRNLLDHMVVTLQKLVTSEVTSLSDVGRVNTLAFYEVLLKISENLLVIT